MSSHLSVAKQAAKKAGDLLASRFQSYNRSRVKFKAQNELVTSVDLESEQLLFRELGRFGPAYSFLSEESGASGGSNEYRWIIDPMDGTSNFVIGNPLFGVSIALEHDGKIVLGVNYLPLLKQLFWAEAGRGALLNGKRISVSSAQTLARATCLLCHGKNRKNLVDAQHFYKIFLSRHIRLRHFGSAVYEMMAVASGRADVYLSSGLRLWDLAAGSRICEEAGARLTDFQGRPWTLASQTLAISNKKIHSPLLRFIGIRR